MKTSATGMDLIKSFESLRLKAYRCPAGVLTIGYGHTGNVKTGDVITEQTAEYLLSIDLQDAERAVNQELSGLNQNQFDALVSFVFNVGERSFKNSTLLKKIKKNKLDPNIGSEFAKWKYSRGVPLRGLSLRRVAESELYFSE